MVHILCVGDSLTVGFPVETPYADSMREVLANSRSVVVESCDIAALSGYRAEELVLLCDEQMIQNRHFPNEASPGLSHALRSKHYDLVVIMAGTNDLADTADADRVFTALAALHGMAHKAGVKTVALPIPQSAFTNRVEAKAAQREDINRMLETFALSGSGGMSHYVDTDNVIPYYSTQDVEDGAAVSEVEGARRSEVKKLWFYDGLHMSEMGYKALGEYLGRELVARGILAHHQ
eukprot:PhM_4_TR10896/c0_g1_i1/m.19515